MVKVGFSSPFRDFFCCLMIWEHGHAVPSSQKTKQRRGEVVVGQKSIKKPCGKRKPRPKLWSPRVYFLTAKIHGTWTEEDM